MKEEIKKLFIEFQNKVKHQWCKIIFYADNSGVVVDINNNDYFEFENEKELIEKLQK